MPAFTSHAQLVRRGDAGALLADPAFPRLLRLLTLAGDGRLRADRAAAGLVDEVLAPETAADRVGEPGLRRAERLAIRQRLTATSSAFSVRMDTPVGGGSGSSGGSPGARVKRFLLTTEDGGGGAWPSRGAGLRW